MGILAISFIIYYGRISAVKHVLPAKAINGIIKRFLTGGTAEVIVFCFTGFSGACKHIANMMQAKTCFLVRGLTKKDTQYIRSVT